MKPAAVQLRTLKPGVEVDFDTLYRCTYVQVVRTLWALTGSHAAAEDCAQETFVRAWRAWPRYRPEAPVEAWVYAIAVRVASNWRRSHRLRDVREVLQRLGRPAPEESDPASGAQFGPLAWALRRLPRDDVAMLVLHHLHGYNSIEIAGLVGKPERTVRWRLERSRRQLAELLSAEAPALPQRRAPGVVRV